MRCMTPVKASGILRPCRKCKACFLRKQREIRGQCLLEAAFAKKVHFLTLTFRPVAARDYVIIQRFLKRVRKSVCSDFKYVCVTEPHKRKDRLGRVRVHYHLLIFDHIGVSLRSVRQKWRGGFSTNHLVRDNGGIYYVTKYIRKYQGDHSYACRKSGFLGEGYWRSGAFRRVIDQIAPHFAGHQIRYVRFKVPLDRRSRRGVDHFVQRVPVPREFRMIKDRRYVFDPSIPRIWNPVNLAAHCTLL